MSYGTHGASRSAATPVHPEGRRAPCEPRARQHVILRRLTHLTRRSAERKYERIDLLRPVRGQLAQALGDVITVARVPWKQRISAFATEELEIAVSIHAGTPEKIFDDERRNRPVRGDDQGSRHTRLGVGQMISTLAAEDKAIFFKDGEEVSVVNRTNGGHLGRQVDAQPIEGYVLRGQPVSPLVTVARLL